MTVFRMEKIVLDDFVSVVLFVIVSVFVFVFVVCGRWWS